MKTEGLDENLNEAKKLLKKQEIFEAGFFLCMPS
jgi:hypothetical protein